MTRTMMLVFAIVGLAPSTLVSARAPTGIVLLNERESSMDARGRVRDAEVDAAGIAIDAPAELGTISERAAPRIPRKPLHKVGTLDERSLRADIERNFRDMERCRVKVAAAYGLPIDKLAAGEISLHWTILPSGKTRDTLVFESTQTDLVLMKCIRRRMNAWTFAPPSGGPAPVDYDYTFARIGAP